MNNPFDYISDAECDKAFAELVATVEECKKSASAAEANFIAELEAGKMLGVLIAEDTKKFTTFANQK